MSEYLIPSDDLQFLASESSNNLNLILAEMTTMMEENQSKISQLENQTWFQRMAKTISGKNKMTQAEIEQNHDKIDLYISQAMGELFNRNCIDHQLMLGLGNKINALYESQVEIKQIIGAFAQKLNQKIESIDNFHMLIEEIHQGVYDSKNPFLSISQILSQLDLRTIQDQRKMDILKRELEGRGILTHSEILFSQMLENILTLNENDAGTLALFFGNIRNEYVAEIAENTIYTYYTLPEKTRKMKNRHSLVESILRSEDVDLNYTVSSYEMCESLIQASADYIVACAIEEQKNENAEKADAVKHYAEDSMNLMNLLCSMTDSWDASNGELNTYDSRKEYSAFMLNVIRQLDPDSYIGSSIMNSLNNLTFFAQNLFSKYVNYQECVTDIEDVQLTKTAALSVTLDLDKEEYLTASQYYRHFLNKTFHDEENGRTKQLFLQNTLEESCSEFPDTSPYTLFSTSNFYQRIFKVLYRNIFDKVSDLIANPDSLSAVYDLCQRFPVLYDKSFEDELIHKLDLSKPHIEIESPFQGTKQTSINYASVPLLDNYSTTVLLLKFKNIPFDSFTVNRKVLENEYMDFDSFETYKYVDVEWGDWVDHNVLELKLIKHNDSMFGSLKIKISIVQDPSIVAYIE